MRIRVIFDILAIDGLSAGLQPEWCVETISSKKRTLTQLMPRNSVRSAQWREGEDLRIIVVNPP